MSVNIASRRYTYVHDGPGVSPQAVDAHHIFVQKSSLRGFALYLTALLLIANAFFLLFSKESPSINLFWSNIMAIIFIKSLHSKSIKKESVVIMAGFGLQLETHYRSGRVVRHFVPCGKILKPVLNECVTPVTCYWSLGLIMRGEAELLLVFQELRPPVKMLIPVWKALCAASDDKVGAEDVE